MPGTQRKCTLRPGNLKLAENVSDASLSIRPVSASSAARAACACSGVVDQTTDTRPSSRGRMPRGPSRRNRCQAVPPCGFSGLQVRNKCCLLIGPFSGFDTYGRTHKRTCAVSTDDEIGRQYFARPRVRHRTGAASCAGHGSGSRVSRSRRFCPADRAARPAATRFQR